MDAWLCPRALAVSATLVEGGLGQGEAKVLGHLPSKIIWNLGGANIRYYVVQYHHCIPRGEDIRLVLPTFWRGCGTTDLPGSIGSLMDLTDLPGSIGSLIDLTDLPRSIGGLMDLTDLPRSIGGLMDLGHTDCGAAWCLIMSVCDGGVAGH